MKEKTMKNSKGITLIALVITIIILIILAGVSISIVFDEDGIIERAKQAAENMEIAQVEEQTQLNETVEYLENLGTSTKKEYVPYDNPYIPEGFTHTAGTWNNGYTITETSTGNKFVWVPCVLDQTKVKPGDKVVTFGRTLPSTTETTDPYYMYNKSNYTITGDENPASDIKTSVGKYGGFYIAKYEAGVPVDSNNNEIDVASATVTQKARSVSGATVWTDVTRANAITAASNMIDSSVAGVKSGLISGEAWDTTLQWMVNTSDNASSNTGYDIDSTGKGYYGQNAKTTTGQYVVNNIYDMAGNLYEWTTENCTTSSYSSFVCRGGDYDNSASDSSAGHRGSYNVAFSNIGFRVVLYK